jgi:hypothetical protein
LTSNRAYSNIVYNFKTIKFLWSYKQELFFCLFDFNNLWISVNTINCFKKRSFKFKTIKSSKIIRNLWNI